MYHDPTFKLCSDGDVLFIMNELEKNKNVPKISLKGLRKSFGEKIGINVEAAINRFVLSWWQSSKDASKF